VVATASTVAPEIRTHRAGCTCTFTVHMHGREGHCRVDEALQTFSLTVIIVRNHW
jgi:hypothetical protein